MYLFISLHLRAIYTRRQLVEIKFFHEHKHQLWIYSNLFESVDINLGYVLEEDTVLRPLGDGS